MTGLTRGALAALLLEHPMVDGATAAAALIDADLDEPVTMATAPDPAACRSLLRGHWAKAATLANSTDDAQTLAKLARHSSIQVRRAAAANEALPDDERRSLEEMAITKKDRDLFRSVMVGASWSYLVGHLGDAARWALAQGMWRGCTPAVRRFIDLAPQATADDVESIIQTGAGQDLPIMSAINDRVDRLALTCDSRLGGEQHLLEQLVRDSPTVDTVVVSALRRLEAVDAGKAKRLVLSGKQIDEELDVEDSDWLAVHSDISATLFFREPSVERLRTVAQQRGVGAALQALEAAPPDRELIGTLIELAQQSRSMAAGAINNYLTAFGVSDPDTAELLSHAGTAVARKWISGAYGPIDVDDAVRALEMETDLVQACMAARRDQAPLDAIIDAVITRGSDKLFRAVVRHGIKFTKPQAIASLERATAMTDPADLSLSAFTHGDHRGHLASENLSAEQVMVWVRYGGSAELTLAFLGGRMARKPQGDEVDQILADPHLAFERLPIARVVLRNFQEIVGFDVEVLDKLVDAAGVELLSGACSMHRAGGRPFGAYLAERLQRRCSTGDEWKTTFDLLTCSTMPVGETLSAASRLRRRPAG
jgi:hypothetical protein